MIVHRLQSKPSSEVAHKLEEFEKQFTYPLGPSRSFRINHGEDYPRFYRAIGEAAIFVCERKGEILGVMGTAVRPLRQANGETISSLYIGDLKLSPSARGGIVLLRLALAAFEWAVARASVAYGVVMDGTSVTPEKYTGRLGIMPFRAVGKVMVLRFTCSPTGEETESRESSAENGLACFEKLSVGTFTGLGGTPEERSETAALWLMCKDGAACGRLEDTRKAKRLIVDGGVEMKSLHLSCFASESLDAGVELLRSALALTARLGFPALFVSVGEDEAGQILSSMSDVETTVAPATIYGCLLPQGFAWNINTAEI